MENIAVITGGTKGIGKAIIQQFAGNGFDIITCSRNESELSALKKEIETEYSVKLSYLTADMSVKEQVFSFINYIFSQTNKIDVLVNNTGVFLPGQIHNEPDGTLEYLLNTNLISTYYLTQALVKEMMKVKKGHIFNICSTASIMAYPNGGSYCISKFAQLGMTKVLREEMKPFGVRVTAVMPGATLTNSWAGTDLPKERFMDVKDVAKTVWAAFALPPSAVVEEIIMRPQLGDI